MDLDVALVAEAKYSVVRHQHHLHEVQLLGRRPFVINVDIPLVNDTALLEAEN
jgi:hypothetical protein